MRIIYKDQRITLIYKKTMSEEKKDQPKKIKLSFAFNAAPANPPSDDEEMSGDYGSDDPMDEDNSGNNSGLNEDGDEPASDDPLAESDSMQEPEPERQSEQEQEEKEESLVEQEMNEDVGDDENPEQDEQVQNEECESQSSAKVIQQKKAPTFRLTKAGSLYIANERKAPVVEETPVDVPSDSASIQEESLDKISDAPLAVKIPSEILKTLIGQAEATNNQQQDPPELQPQPPVQTEAPRKKISLFMNTTAQAPPAQPTEQPVLTQPQPLPATKTEKSPEPEQPPKPLIQLKTKKQPEEEPPKQIEEVQPAPLNEENLVVPKSKISITKQPSPKAVPVAPTAAPLTTPIPTVPVANSPLTAANINLAQVLQQSIPTIPPMLPQMLVPPPAADNEQSYGSNKVKRADPVSFTRFYELKKRSLTMEITNTSLEKAQMIFELGLCPDAEQNIQELKTDAPLEFSFHSKQVTIKDIYLLKPKEGLSMHNISNYQQLEREKQLTIRSKLPMKPIFDKKKLRLGNPQEQAKYQEEVYFNLSKNLIQMEEVEQLAYKLQLEQGTHKIKRERLLSVKKDDKTSQLRPKIWLLVEYECMQLADVGGIRLTRYLQDREDVITTQQISISPDNINDHRMRQAIYLHTTDFPEQSLCWMPCMVGSHRTQTPWQLNFVVPANYTVLASGHPTHHQVDSTRAIYKYECEPAIADKIGFICSPTPYETSIQSRRHQQLRNRQVVVDKSSKTAYFVSKQKQKEFGEGAFITEICDDMTGLLAQNPGSYPTPENKLVFVPNLFPHKDLKQSYDFAGGLHIFDQHILFKGNQVEDRHKAYKHIASALAFDYFGAQITEKTPADNWLLQAIRERFGDRYKKHKCGTYMYRYHVHKQISKLYSQISKGIEGGPLQRSVKNAVNNGELGRLGQNPCEQMLSDIFLRKCSLLMHMFESTVSERVLNTIIKEMYIEAMRDDDCKLEGDKLYRKCRKYFGKDKSKDFFDNWIWSTSCPKLELSYDFNKRHNQIDLQVKQTSAIQDHYRFKDCLQSKLGTVFGKKGNELKRSIYQDLLIQNHTNNNISVNAQKILDCLDSMDDTFGSIDVNRAAKRWFTGNLNIMIYQVDGSSGDILAQHYKLKLQNFKTKVDVHIPLDGKVKRTMQNRRRELDYTYLMQDTQKHPRPNSMQRIPGQPQVTTSQPMLNQDVWKFEMNEFELEDFPQDTKNIFQNRELDNNPVLWIRVDPDMEYIRKVTVIQEKRNNWLFQLLRERDIIGQIEAVKALQQYNESTVYEILKTVARNENYFVKVRQQVVKALGRMQIGQFNEYVSHEMFLLKFFNRRNFDEESGFYKPNNFENLLEYYMDKALIKALSKCKEHRLQLTSEKENELEKLRESRETQFEDPVKEEIKENKEDNEASYCSKKSDASQGKKKLKLSIVKSSQGAVRGPGTSQKQLEAEVSEALKKLYPTCLKESDFRTTTDVVANMLFKVLEQSDNSENKFDDSFYIGHLLDSLGRLDNFTLMPVIAEEVLRQFKLDQIANSSAISIGAIKAYFNMRKQIFKYTTVKSLAMDKESLIPQSVPMGIDQEIQDENEKTVKEMVDQKIKETETYLDEMHILLRAIFRDPYMPLQVKLFVFQRRIKEIFLHSDFDFIKALKIILETIYEIQDANQPSQQIRFSIQCLRQLTLYLEGSDLINKMNFTELFNNNPDNGMITTLWDLFICHPCNFLTSELSFWAKRIIKRLYGNQLPQCADESLLKKRQEKYSDHIKAFTFTPDKKWEKTAAELQKEAVNLEEKRQNALQEKNEEQVMEEQKEKLRFDLKPQRPLDTKLHVPPVNKPQMNPGKISFQLGAKREANTNLREYETIQAPPQPNRSFKISLGGFKNERSISAASRDGSQDLLENSFIDSISMQDIKEQKSEGSDIQREQTYQNQKDEGEEDSKVIDVFADEKFEGFLQNCWLALGELYYHYEAGEFIDLSPDTLGKEMYDQYIEEIPNPMCVTWIMNKIRNNGRTNQYRSEEDFKRDVQQIFTNCMDFNDDDSEIFKSAIQLKFFFKQKCREYNI